MRADRSRERLVGVWSATPTPFTDALELDLPSVARMVDHHLRLGVKGLFVAGTCGEGAWMRDRTRRDLVREAVRHSRQRLVIAVQVTDNSAHRILDNMHAAAEDGADIAVIAPPHYLLNATPANVRDLYLQAIRESPLPVGIYDRGKDSAVIVPEQVLRVLYAEPKVVMVKDSSTDPVRRDIALAARRKRPELVLLSGYEFDCVSYLSAGYDGLLLGGGIFNAMLARQIMEAVAAGDVAAARKLQERMNRLMYEVYGGKTVRCWLHGLKHLLVQMGIFSTTASYLRYPLTQSCVRAIARALERERDVLLPR